MTQGKLFRSPKLSPQTIAAIDDLINNCFDRGESPAMAQKMRWAHNLKASIGSVDNRIRRLAEQRWPEVRDVRKLSVRILQEIIDRGTPRAIITAAPAPDPAPQVIEVKQYLPGPPSPDWLEGYRMGHKDGFREGRAEAQRAA